MADVIKYLKERDIDPDKFSAPIDWHKEDYNPDEKIPKTKSLTEKQKQKLRAQCNKKMRAYPDVLTTKDIAAITGYNRNSVSKWCTKGLLKSLHMGNQYLVPKIYLLEFMLGPDFRGIKGCEHNSV